MLLGCTNILGCVILDKEVPPNFSYFGKWESVLDYDNKGLVYSYLELSQDGTGISFKVSSKGEVYHFIEFQKTDLIRKGNHLEIQLPPTDLGQENKLAIIYYDNEQLIIYRLYENEPKKYVPRNPGNTLDKVSEKSAFVQNYLEKRHEHVIHK